MSATMDFDRLLASVLDAEGPERAPAALVEAALTESRALPSAGRPSGRSIGERGPPRECHSPVPRPPA